MCSQIHGSIHFVFEGIDNFAFTDDGYTITHQIKIYVVDEVFGVVKELVKDVKDSFMFHGMSTCGKGFFAEIDEKRENYIYLCTPITDQALVFKRRRYCSLASATWTEIFRDEFQTGKQNRF
jgi:hypothetical protein